jgi:hypothetical protein
MLSMLQQSSNSLPTAPQQTGEFRNLDRWQRSRMQVLHSQGFLVYDVAPS